MALTRYILGTILELCTNTNTNLIFGIEDVRGVNNQKKMIKTKADLNGRDLSKFQIVNPGDFVFNHRTSRELQEMDQNLVLLIMILIHQLFVQKIMLFLTFELILKIL